MESGDHTHNRMERFYKTMDDVKEELHKQNHMLCEQALQIYNTLLMHSHEGDAKYHHMGPDGKFGYD